MHQDARLPYNPAILGTFNFGNLPVSTATDSLPLTDTQTPADQESLTEALRAALASGTPVYPLGGETSLDQGLPATLPGLGLSLRGLNRVVDYPARDMTITVESGITMSALSETLAAQGQWLPIEVPQAEQATLGGAVVTNFSGPRRYGYGTIRDYVIGIRAVDGHGTTFNAGGRVVKNVAGYDLCKLMIGSFGTLGVVTQLTLKVKPRPPATAQIVGDLTTLSQAEPLLSALVELPAPAAAIELLSGPVWETDEVLGDATPGTLARLVVALDGTAAEVDFLTAAIEQSWQSAAVTNIRRVKGKEQTALESRMREFPTSADALVIKASMVPSGVTNWLTVLHQVDPQASVLAHAGSGIVIARCALPAAQASAALVHQLQPAALAQHGNLVVLSAPSGMEQTCRAVWGSALESAGIMRSIKSQFDPHGLLNPGRFVYGTT